MAALTPRITPVTPVPDFLKAPPMDPTIQVLVDWIQALSARVLELELRAVREDGRNQGDSHGS